MNENNNNFDNICIDKDILKIKTSICKDLNPKKDYPKLEIWKDGKKIEEIIERYWHDKEEYYSSVN